MTPFIPHQKLKAKKKQKKNRQKKKVGQSTVIFGSLVRVWASTDPTFFRTNADR